MATRAETARSFGSALVSENFLFPTLLAAFVLISRILCRGPLYFGDGPGQVGTIITKTYIVQPPGYWLFDRTAGLFSDPVLAISAMNILFSVAGVVVFYYTACLLTGKLNAFLAALAYSTLFYLWFSGEIHSTYATQIFFPVTTFYLLLMFDRKRAAWMLWLAALSFAAGAGMRPSDGAFMIPMAMYFAVFRMTRKEGLVFLSLISLFCLGWLIPTWHAFRYKDGSLGPFATYCMWFATNPSILTGIRPYTLANFVRYGLPIIVGFWPVLGIAVLNAIRNRSDWRVKAMLIWILPGSLFFVLIFISNAPYLDFLSAAILLLAVSAPRLMLLTAIWNAVVFLAISPIPSKNLAMNVTNCFVLHYTHGGIQQRKNATLSELEGWAGHQ